MILGIIGWIVIGLIVGFVASKAVNLRGDDPRLTIGVAAAAAIVAGLLHRFIGGTGETVWNPWGLLFAALGAILAAVIWLTVRSRYASKERYVPRRSY